MAVAPATSCASPPALAARSECCLSVRLLPERVIKDGWDKGHGRVRAVSEGR